VAVWVELYSTQLHNQHSYVAVWVELCSTQLHN